MEYRPVNSRQCRRNGQTLHIGVVSEPRPGQRWAMMDDKTLCNVWAANFPETGTRSKMAAVNCQGCIAEYRKRTGQPVRVTLGRVQRSVLDLLVTNGGEFHRGCGWMQGTYRVTVRILESLSSHGLVTVDTRSRADNPLMRLAVYRLTATGQAYLTDQLEGELAWLDEDSRAFERAAHQLNVVQAIEVGA